MKEIRKIKAEEVCQLIEFIRQEWKADHVFVKSHTLLDFQHKEGEYYSFYGVWNDDELIAINGYIPLGHYDAELFKDGDIWGAIWKVKNDGKGYGGIGLELRDFMHEDLCPKSHGSIGVSSVAWKIDKYVYKWSMGYFHQYYIANRTISQFHVCSNPIVELNKYDYNQDWTITMDVIPSLLQTSIDIVYRPRKSIKYIINRYERHPIYKYIFWGIYKQNKLINLWVVRRIIVDDTSIFRVVDVLGDLSKLPNLTEQLQELMKKESIEYIDFLNYGISSDIFAKIGFKELDYNQENCVIPNYFEPFLKENVQINLAYCSKYPYVAFKGDADQDRPNIL